METSSTTMMTKEELTERLAGLNWLAAKKRRDYVGAVTAGKHNRAARLLAKIDDIVYRADLTRDQIRSKR
jgi:hypothetical protein